MFKKSLLLMLLMAFMAPWAVMGQVTETATCYPPTQEFATGYTDGTTKTSGEMHAVCNGGVRGWMKFDISSIPDNATINSIKLWFYCYDQSNPYVYVTSAGELNPATASASDLFSGIGINSPNYYEIKNLSSPEWKSYDLKSDAVSKLQSNLTNDYFTVGFWAYETFGSYYFYTYGYDNADYKPYIEVTYTPYVPYVTLTPTSALVLTGFTATLTATPMNVTGTPEITFTTSDATVATVSSDGYTATVTAVAAGEATVTATMNYQGTNYPATSIITVEDPSYCTPSFSNTSDYIISFSTTGGEHNISNTSNAQGAGGYSNFYDSHYVSAEPGTTISFTATATNDTYYYAIWVDWNKDYVFDNSTERVAVKTTKIRNWSDSFTIPSGTEVGEYHMRVLQNYTNNIIPCASNNYGEGEDYKLTVTAPVSCKVPTDLAADATAHAASLSWTANNNESAWKLYYKEADATDYTEVATGVTNPYNLTNLDDDTNYEFYVVANCGVGGESNPSEVFSFSTEVACPAPTSLTASALSTTVTASWSGTADSYDVCYSTENTLPATIQYTAIEGTSKEITGLNVGTYNVWVRANCNGEDPSAWVGPVNASVDYCTPNPSSRDGLGITGVSFGTGSNTVNNSNTTSGLPANEPYYGNYSSTMIGAVEAGTNAVVSITTSTVGYSSYPYGFIIWVDWNNDLLFSDAEIVFTGQCAEAAGTLEATFEIPVTQSLGDYRMRIAGADTYFDSYINTGSGDHDPCFSHGYAVCHDYTLRVLAGNPCTLLPTNFSFEPSHTSATVTWETTDGVSCDIYYSTENTAPANNVTQAGITGNENSYSYTINGLTANTPYYVWVRVNCDETLHGNWTSAGSFTTLNYDAPTALSFSTTYNSATASWTAPHDNIVSYTYQYEAEGVAMVEGTTADNTPSVNLSGLTQSTTYTFRVKANYPGSHSSEFAESTFNTPAQYPAPTGLTTTNIKTYGATLAWNEAAGATGYNLRYRTTMGGTEQVGDDVTLEKQAYETYTFDLSGFSGTGRLAIRHYNCNDMMYLKVNEVTVIDGSVTILSEDFTGSTNLPEGWNAIDEDGDGKNWGIDSDGYAISYSYQGGKLYPDNWLITPEIQLGGNMTVIAGAGSSSYYAETFGIFVLTSGTWNEVIPLTEATYTASLEAQTGYDVQVNAVYDANTSAWSEVFSFTTLPVKRFIATNPSYQQWSYSSSWEPSGVPTADHDVVIEENVTISSYTTAQANNITIADGKTLTLDDGGQLICNNNPIVTVKKNIEAATDWDSSSEDWYFIASPVNTQISPANITGMITSGEDGDYDLYQLNHNSNLWENYKEHEGNAAAGFNLVNGRGYLYASESGTTIEFTGAIKPYDATYTVGGEGWNLVGNPYTFKAYVNQSHYTLNSYGDAIEPATSASAAIDPCTGVIVNGEATFYNAATTTQSNSNGYIQLALTQQVTRGTATTLDNAIVSFNEGEQLGKFYFAQQNANLYIPQGAEEYAIAYSNGQGEMPVSFKANENGQYTITVNAENVEMNYLHLIDNMTGMDIDLLQTPSYTFNATVTDYESRFRLVFVSNGASTGSATDETFAFCSNGNWIIANEGQATLQVVDLNGRILSSETVNGSVSKSINAPAGMYLLRLINGENVKVQKIVVR